MRKVSTKSLSKKRCEPYVGYYDPEQVRMREEIIEISKRDAEWKVKGFAKFVINQGYMAVAPPDRDGSVRSWQQVGRDLFGEEVFNKAVREELERRRAAQT